jgi:mono/diheme cytochrome c family protein
MKTVLKWLLRLILLVVVVIAGFIGYAYWRSSALMAKTYDVKIPKVVIPTDEASIARGKHLAHNVSLCTECHGDDLGGKVIWDNFAFGRLAGTNLTRGRGGIGRNYRDKDFVCTLVHGVKPSGRSVIFMPSADYQFTEADLGALVAYIKSLPPVDRELPERRVGPMPRALAVFATFPLVPADKIDHAHVRFAEVKDRTDPVAAGDYLISTAGCRGCHGPDLTGGGGPPPGGANITPVGLSGWSPKDFVTAIRDHKRPNGTTIDEAMPRIYGQMSDEDLQKVFAYLESVPAKGAKTKNQQKSSD